MLKTVTGPDGKIRTTARGDLTQILREMQYHAERTGSAQCTALEAENESLRREVSKLKKQIGTLGDEIAKRDGRIKTMTQTLTAFDKSQKSKKEA